MQISSTIGMKTSHTKHPGEKALSPLDGGSGLSAGVGGVAAGAGAAGNAGVVSAGRAVMATWFFCLISSAKLKTVLKYTLSLGT